MRIALWNGSGVDNIGDRLLDHVNRQELGRRLPTACFETFCPWPSATASGSIRPHRLRIDRQGHWDGEGSFDAIVIGGGGILLGPPFRHPGAQFFFLGPFPERFRDRCPVVWNAVSSEGIRATAHNSLWREFVQAAAERIKLRTVRNESTREFLTRCGITGSVSLVPDPVVLLSTPAKRKSRPASTRRIGIAVARSVFPTSLIAQMLRFAIEDARCINPCVSVSPSDFTQWADTDFDSYDDLDFANRFADAMGPVNPGDTIEVCGFGAMYGDGEAAEALAGVLEQTRLVHLTHPLGVDALEWIASLDCLVASRLHACILALVVGTPVVAIDPYYDEATGTSKLREFMSTAQGVKHHIPMNEFLKGERPLIEWVDSACSTAESLPVIHESLCEAASAHFDTLAEILST